MATDVASLAIRVASLEAEQASRRLDDLANSGGKAERATDGLMGSFKRLAGPVLAAVSVMKVFGDAIGVQRRYDQLSSTLTTVTGSAEDAAEVFKVLQQYADRTPFAIENLNEAFIKLVNYGLDPSERALTSYGNTATSLGKDITEMVGAVANATTGNFQSLQSFGIRTKNMGDTVAFTFRGVTTTVKNSASEIEGYLMGLGENDFANAMENSLGKLDDTILGLGEQWDTLLLNIMQSGVGEAIQSSIQVAVDALMELNAMFASGEMEAYLESMSVQFEYWGRDIADTVDILTKFLKDNFGEWEDEGEGAIQFLIDAFRQFPSNVRAFIQIMTVEVASGLDQVMAYAGAFKDGIKALFTDDTLADVGARLEQRVQIARDTRRDMISDILEERDVALKAADDQIAKARELRREYDERMASDQGDRLARFRIAGDGSASGGVDKAAAAAAKARKREFDSLVESLRTEEEAIAASYEKRKAIIEANTGVETELRADLMRRLEADRAEQLKKLETEQGAELESLRQSLRTQEEAIQESYDKRMDIIRRNTEEGSALREQLESRTAADRDRALADVEKRRQAERDSLYNSLLTEEESLRQSYERKKELILNSEEVTELERQDLLRRLQQQFADEQAAMENRRIQQQLGAGEALFGGLAGLAKTYAGEQSSAYRALFAVSKAFSITQAAMSIATGLAKAQELGFPANLAEMARVGATGAGILAQINGAQFSGAYDKGGQIAAGKIGIVGEYGPEFVRGPAAITGRQLTERQMADGEGGSSAPAPQTNLRIVNAFDTSVVGDYMGSDAGEEIIMNAVRRNATTVRSLAAGGS